LFLEPAQNAICYSLPAGFQHHVMGHVRKDLGPYSVNLSSSLDFIYKTPA
jgi:hypothetical protein